MTIRNVLVFSDHVDDLMAPYFMHHNVKPSIISTFDDLKKEFKEYTDVFNKNDEQFKEWLFTYDNSIILDDAGNEILMLNPIGKWSYYWTLNDLTTEDVWIMLWKYEIHDILFEDGKWISCDDFTYRDEWISFVKDLLNTRSDYTMVEYQTL